MQIPYSLDPEQVKYFSRSFSAEPLMSGKVHPHGVLALQRKLVEKQMFLTIAEQKLAGSIREGIMVDIGSSPVRLRQYHNHEELWCCMPLILPADAFRVQKCRENGYQGYCTCRVLDCNCTPRPTVYTSTHSIYYFTPSQIALLISKCTSGKFFAVHHIFPNLFGKFGPEATYQIAGNNIVMFVAGNDCPYTHANPSWLNYRNGIQLDTKYALVWDKITQVGETQLTQFMLCEMTIPRAIHTNSLTTLSQTPHQPMYYVPMATSDHPMDLDIETYMLTIDSVQSFAHGFITVMFKDTKAVPVNVPRGLVEFVSSKLLFTERNGASLLDARHHATAYCTKINMPPELFADSILYGSVLGMLATLDKEINLLNTASRNNFGKLSWHTQLLKFGAFQFPYWRYLYLFTPTIGIIAPLLYVYFLSPSPGPNTSYLGSIPHYITTFTMNTTWQMKAPVGIYLLFNMTFNYLNYYAHANQTWSVKRHHGDMASCNIDTPYQLVLDPEFKGVISNKPFVQQRATATVVINAHDPNPPKHPGTTPTRLELATIGFTTISPTVLEPTKDMEILAIRNRVVREVSQPTPEAKERLFSVLDRAAFHHLTDVVIPYNQATYTEWNRRFPGAIQKKHNEARSLITDHTRSNKFHSISKAFIKMEKVSFSSTPDGVEDATPRLIQGQPVHQNVVLGPWMYKFTQHMKGVWNGKQTNVYFTSGQTADEIGAWFTKCTKKYKSPAFVMIDYVKYDSTINEATREFTDEICKRCGITQHPPVLDALRTDAIQEGYTRHGVYYKTNDGTGSGRANTTCKNSKVNAAIALGALLDDTQFDTAVNGDDNLIVGEEEYLREHWQLIVDFAKELGFEPKARYTTHIHEVDFCSKIPYPAVDPETKQEVCVFGPKLGKLLHKIGWNLNKAGVKSQAQTMRELMKSCRHIPFIYEFARAVNSRLKNKDFKHIADPSYWDTNKSYEVSPSVYLWVLTPRYGLTPLDLEEFVNTLNLVPSPLENPVVIQYSKINYWCETDDKM